MSRVYIWLLGITAFLLAATGASFSIIGLGQLFSGAQLSTGVMAGVLELSKLVVTGFLYRYWGHVPRIMRVYLSAAIVILMCITSLGIYGYLSNAFQKSAYGLHQHQLKVAALEAQNVRVKDRMEEIQRFIKEIPRNRISKKLQIHQEYEPMMHKLQRESEKIISDIDALNMELLDKQAKIGPIIYVAQAMHIDVDTCVKYLILLFVSVFDPLAVCLVFSLSLAIRLREKYGGNEIKIAAHSLTTPVDHRFRKAG